MDQQQHKRQRETLPEKPKNLEKAVTLPKFSRNRQGSVEPARLGEGEIKLNESDSEVVGYPASAEKLLEEVPERIIGAEQSAVKKPKEKTVVPRRSVIDQKPGMSRKMLRKMRTKECDKATEAMRKGSERKKLGEIVNEKKVQLAQDMSEESGSSSSGKATRNRRERARRQKQRERESDSSNELSAKSTSTTANRNRKSENKNEFVNNVNNVEDE